MSDVRVAPVRSGWMLLLVSAAILTLCMGLRQGLGLFLRPVTADLGISVSAFSFALALQSMVWGASQPFIGMLADRYGTRPVLIGTALVYAGGLLVMSMAGSAAALDLGGGLLIGIGIAGTGFGVLVGVVARAVPLHRQSQAVGTVAALGSLGTFFLPPIGQALMDAHGWRTALAVYAGIAACMALLALASMPPAAGGKTPSAADDSLARRCVARGRAASRLYRHDRRLLRLRLPTRLHHHSFAILLGVLRVAAERRRECARRYRSLQHGRHLHRRPAGRALQPEAPPGAGLYDPHLVDRRRSRGARHART